MEHSIRQHVNRVRDTALAGVIGLAYLGMTPWGRAVLIHNSRKEIEKQIDRWVQYDTSRRLTESLDRLFGQPASARDEHDERCLSREPGMAEACDCAFWEMMDVTGNTDVTRVAMEDGDGHQG
jgi:hypothetical protein